MTSDCDGETKEQNYTLGESVKYVRITRDDDYDDVSGGPLLRRSCPSSLQSTIDIFQIKITSHYPVEGRIHSLSIHHFGARQTSSVQTFVQ